MCCALPVNIGQSHDQYPQSRAKQRPNCNFQPKLACLDYTPTLLFVEEVEEEGSGDNKQVKSLPVKYFVKNKSHSMQSYQPIKKI